MPDAATLVGVLDQEGHLGFLCVDGVIPPGGDDLVLQRDDEGHSTVVVDRGEAFDVLLRQVRIGREEAEVLRLIGYAVVELDEALRVGREDRPDLRRTTVLEQDIGFPVLDGILRCGHV